MDIWRLLWNVMAVIGIISSVLAVFMFMYVVISETAEKRKDGKKYDRADKTEA